MQRVSLRRLQTLKKPLRYMALLYKHQQPIDTTAVAQAFLTYTSIWGEREVSANYTQDTSKAV
jgi:hypothetical protein